MTVTAAAAPQRIAAPALVAPDQPAPRSVTERFFGTWQLVSWIIQQADGELIDSPWAAILRDGSRTSREDI